MYAITAVGVLMMAFSIVMIVSPLAWSRGIVRFAEQPYFHLVEVVSRIGLGALILYFADSTKHPTVMSLLGGLFLLAGVILVIVGQDRHRAFAVRSSTFVKIFRPAGVASLLFGGFIVYSAVA